MDKYKDLPARMSKSLKKQGFTSITMDTTAEEFPVVVKVIFLPFSPPKNLVKIQAKIKKVARRFRLQPVDFTISNYAADWQMTIRFKHKTKKFSIHTIAKKILRRKQVV